MTITRLQLSGILFIFMMGFFMPAATSSASPAETSNVSLQAGFQDPPIAARAGAFWPWLNANVDRERLRYDLQQMKEKGMGSAEIWDVQALRNTESIPAGPEFLSPESVANIKIALAEGRKLGLRMGMITSSGWNAGGTWVTPDWASKMLIHSATTTTGPIGFSEKLPFPEPPKECPIGPDGKPVFYKDIAVLAVPATDDHVITSSSQVVNLTDKLQPDGTLTWNAPAGAWHILRFVCTNTGQSLIVPSPKSSGLFIDFLDPDATRRHLQLILDRLGITPENAAESGLNYLEVDSMELHKGNPWTDKFAAWFKKYRGYDPTQWMPVLAGWTIKDKAASDAFTYDYRKTVSDLLIHSHYETGSEFLKKYGMDFVGEAGGPGPPIWDTCPVDALKALGNVTIPRGEFWIQHKNIFLVKEIASAAHTYGKPIVDAESFTTWRRWQDAPAALKKIADRAFAEGLNHITIHTFAHSPESAGLPGRAYHAGVDINPNVTWWPLARPFFDYLARCSWMLRQGQPVADVLWYYGDQAPNFFPSFNNVPEKPRLPGLGRGYDFDVVNSDVILNRLQVSDGEYVLPEGTTYQVLAIAPTAAVTLEVLQKLQSFVEKGGVLVGAPPTTAPGLHDHAQRTRQMQQIAGALWGDNPTTGSRQVGNGRVYYGIALDDVLAAEKIAPDLQIANWSARPDIDYIHRRSADADIYFVRNASDQPAIADARFRVTGGQSQLWNPATGEIASTSSDSLDGETTSMTLHLAPGESQFIVFARNGDAPRQALRSTASTLPVSGPWRLSFPPHLGAPKQPVNVDTLKSWTDFARPGIKYFSGIADYTTTITLPAGWLAPGTEVLLNLGNVADMAEVTVNGTAAGIVWTSPYKLVVTPLLQPGENILSVKVANLWHNRLVGDANAPPEKRITHTNWPTENKKKEKLQKAGLLGPVTLEKTLNDR